MDKIQRCADALIEAIREGETYLRYRACEKKLEAHPQLRAQIDEFRAAAYRLHNGDNGSDLYEKSDEFERKYQDFRKNSMVNEYLEAELDVCRLMQKIGDRIQTGVEIQIPQV